MSISENLREGIIILGTCFLSIIAIGSLVFSIFNYTSINSQSNQFSDLKDQTKEMIVNNKFLSDTLASHQAFQEKITKVVQDQESQILILKENDQEFQDNLIKLQVSQEKIAKTLEDQVSQISILKGNFQAFQEKTTKALDDQATQILTLKANDQVFQERTTKALEDQATQITASKDQISKNNLLIESVQTDQNKLAQTFTEVQTLKVIAGNK